MINLKAIVLSAAILLTQKDYIPVVSLEDIHALKFDRDTNEVYIGIFNNKNELSNLGKYKIMGIDNDENILFIQLEEYK